MVISVLYYELTSKLQNKMKKIMLGCLLLLGVVPVVAQRKHLLYDINFNDWKINKTPSMEVNDSTAIVVSDSVKRYGDNSVRVEVKSTNATIKGIRAEFAFKPETYPERWYGLSIFAPSNYLADPEPEIVTQWHNEPDFKLGEGWLSPSTSLWVKNGRWVFDIIWDTAKVTIQEHWMGRVDYDLGTVKLNAWTDWVFHIKFSYKSEGLVEIYKNGVKVYTRNGPNDFNDAVLPYWKIGLYKWVYKDHEPTHHKYNQRVLFYSQIREGDEKATFADVTPSL